MQDFANTLGLTGLQEITSVGKTDKEGLDRREWRINAKTGNLKGIAWRFRGLGKKDANGKYDRHTTRYVGKRESPVEFARYTEAFERWRRTHNNPVGVGEFAAD